MADSLAAQIDESTQEIIDTTQLMMPQFSVMMNLVTRKDIPKGKKEAELPFVNSFPTVQTPTEGDEITTTSQFDLSSVTITPTIRADSHPPISTTASIGRCQPQRSRVTGPTKMYQIPISAK